MATDVKTITVLSRTSLNQLSIVVNLKSSLRWFCVPYHDLVYRQEIYVSFSAYHRILNRRNTTGGTGEAETAYLSGEPEFTHCFSGVCVAQSLFFCVVFCRSSSFCPFSFDHCTLCLFFDLWLLITPLAFSIIFQPLVRALERIKKNQQVQIYYSQHLTLTKIWYIVFYRLRLWLWLGFWLHHWFRF